MKVAIAVFEGVHLLDLTGPAQIFYEGMKMGSEIEVEFISTSTDKMTYISSAGLSFTATQKFQRTKLLLNDIVIVPGLDYRLISDELFLNSIKPFIDWLKEQNREGVKICSVCTGAFILGEAEIINHKSCTTHWRYCDRLVEQYPGIKIQKKRLFVQDTNIYTTAGMSSGIDLSLYLIEEYFGTELASAIAREVVLYLRRGEGDPQLSIFLQYRNHLEDRIHTIQEWLLHHFNERNNIENLAEKVFMSPRNLVRLFKKTTGITIGQYIDKLRLEHASKLLSDNYKIEYVSQSCGFNSSDQLRHLFKKYKFSLPSKFKIK